jgi:pimeloyl-ACP methyl ester carboxylesterase
MTIENTFQHQQIDINGISTHIIEAGDNKRPTILFLHGYPGNWYLLECNGPIKRKLSYFISGYA